MRGRQWIREEKEDKGKRRTRKREVFWLSDIFN
jgi:hypothetical protein